MTDRPDSSADDSPEIAEVRRLLADSRHTGPMPDDVVARMDRVLVELNGARDAAPVEPLGRRDAEVVPTAAHRRRRAAGLLVAAAAIVVAGVAVAQNLPSAGESGASTAGGAEERATAGGDTSADKGGPDLTNGSPTTPSSTDSPRGGVLQHGRLVVRARHFIDDALEGRRLLDGNFARVKDVDHPCTRLAGQVRAVPAEYQGAPAVLVFRRPEGTSQVVDLFVCGASQPVRSATLPAP